MTRIYLVMAVIGAAVPLSVFVPWAVEHGLDLGLMIREATADPIPRFFTLDLVISALVVTLMAIEAHLRGVRRAWLAVLGTCAVGVSFGLPLLLYLRSRARDLERGRA